MRTYAVYASRFAEISEHLACRESCHVQAYFSPERRDTYPFLIISCPKPHSLAGSAADILGTVTVVQVLARQFTFLASMPGILPAAYSPPGKRQYPPRSLQRICFTVA
jgi:hypothetical protein